MTVKQQVPSGDPARSIAALKQQIEIISGVRGSPIQHLSDGYTLSDVGDKLTQLLSLLQNTSSTPKIGGAKAGKPVSELSLTEYLTPVEWDGVHDRVLGIGQSAKSSFTAATSMPLHIACADGQIYEMEIVGNYTVAAAAAQSYLQPNNAVPTTNSFTLETFQAYNATVVSAAIVASADGGFMLMRRSSVMQGKFTFFTSTATKRHITNSLGRETTNGICRLLEAANWDDTTTVWSSFGTVIMPNAWTGVITVTRKA